MRGGLFPAALYRRDFAGDVAIDSLRRPRTRRRRLLPAAAAATAAAAACAVCFTASSSSRASARETAWRSPTFSHPLAGQPSLRGVREVHRRDKAAMGMQSVPVSLSGTSAQDVETKSDSAFSIFLETCVYSSLWMSANLASLIIFVQLMCGSAVNWKPCAIGFCESVVVYTLDHLRDLRRVNTSTGYLREVRPVHGLARYRGSILRALFLVGLAGFFYSLSSAPSWRIGAIFSAHLVLGASYAKLKRRLPYMKAFCVSFSVVSMAVAAPIAYMPGIVHNIATATWGQMMLLLFCVSLTIENLQDLRDIQDDHQAGIVTLPSGIGGRRTKDVLHVVQACSVALHFVLASFLPSQQKRPEFLAVYALCSLATVGFRESMSKWMFQVILEPLYTMPLIVIAIRMAMG